MKSLWNRFDADLSKKVRSPAGITIVALAAVLVVLALGWASTQQQVASATASTNAVQQKLDHANESIDALKASQEASEQARQAVQDKQDELDEKIAAADAQQQKLDEAQQKVIASQLEDGVHVVGTDTAPGVYSTTDTTNCYYAWKTGTGADASIVDNNIVSGPATVTLKAGETFETNRCGTWNKVG